MIKKKLRGGAETSDPRLDRVPWFDVRSLNWPVSALFPVGAERVPKVWDCGDHLDQGAEGACTGYAVAHELIAKPKAVKGITSTFAREDLYWEAQKIDPFEGGAYPGAEPFMEGSTVLAAAKVAQRLGYITEYRWAFGLDDLILSVGHLGPAILGVSWFEGMMTPAKDGQIRATGARVGGHAILCKGVRTKRETFVLHNSWGTDWGNGGDCHISWEDMDKLLKDNGEACIPLVRVKNPDVG